MAQTACPSAPVPGRHLGSGPHVGLGGPKGWSRDRSGQAEEKPKATVQPAAATCQPGGEENKAWGAAALGHAFISASSYPGIILVLLQKT